MVLGAFTLFAVRTVAAAPHLHMHARVPFSCASRYSCSTHTLQVGNIAPFAAAAGSASGSMAQPAGPVPAAKPGLFADVPSELQDARAALKQSLCPEAAPQSNEARTPEQRKQMLQRAIHAYEAGGCFLRNNFYYYVLPEDCDLNSRIRHSERRSLAGACDVYGADVPLKLLYAFLQRQATGIEGYIIEDTAQTWNEFLSSPERKRAAAAAFNAALCDRLHALIGERPVVEPTASGVFRVFLP